MYLIGNTDAYSNVPMWAQVLRMLQAADSVGKAFGLCCPRHVDTEMQTFEPMDFEKLSPEGGRSATPRACTESSNVLSLVNASTAPAIMAARSKLATKIVVLHVGTGVLGLVVSVIARTPTTSQLSNTPPVQRCAADALEPVITSVGGSAMVGRIVAFVSLPARFVVRISMHLAMLSIVCAMY
ncbi:hypothetical protein IFR05_016423 [Cadophora sp. M221]|nr:hypothetical protein IFR05_016423 [Cadophora sp. M221]